MLYYMGGSSSGFTSVPSKTAEEAENIFKKAVQASERGAQPRGERQPRNVFISFSVTDEAMVNLLRAQAKREEFGLEFRDYSVKEHIPEKWRKGVSEKIALTSATIVMIGSDTASRSAVNYEIAESYRQGKKVIGVRIYKNETHPIPAEMRKNNARIVNWNMKEIQQELDRP